MNPNTARARSVHDACLSWGRIQSLVDPDAPTHWDRCHAQGFAYPVDVFDQLFHDHHHDLDFGHMVRLGDWGTVRWEEDELSGVALRQIGASRDYQNAVDETRLRTGEAGVQDGREEGMTSWRDDGTWMRAPILVTGDILGTRL